MPLNTDVLLYQPNPTAEVFPLALYDAMCAAIAEAYEVDEVKDIRDKAMAFEVYARQAQNVDAETQACRIRLRAERKAGELLKQIEKAKGAAQPGTSRGTTPSPDGRASPTLAEMGVSYRQASNWQQLAAIPEDQFEAALIDPDHKPSTAGIIAAAAPSKPAVVPVSAEALWLWGRLRDFERDGLLGRATIDVMLTMTPEMADDVHRLAPRVATWLSQIGRAS
jgi:hypothetical protein